MDFCDVAPPQCPDGQVPELEPGCYTGNCIPENECTECTVQACDSGESPCPENEPYAPSACDTDPELRCVYELGGCSFQYRCDRCEWFLESQSPPDRCPGDAFGCQGEGCPEEAVCTDCPCPKPSLPERWRCVWPGDECPPCEPK